MEPRTPKTGTLLGLLLLVTACFAPPPTPAWQLDRDTAPVDVPVEVARDVVEPEPDAVEPADAPDAAEVLDVADVDAPDGSEPEVVEAPDAFDAPDHDAAPCEVQACEPAGPSELGPCERLQWSADACACVPVLVTPGEPCGDDDPCTVDEACSNEGACVGTLLTCDDGDPCTDDACEPGDGCVHAENTASCDDGNPCTLEDACVEGACVGGGYDPGCGACTPDDDTCEAVFGDGDLCNGALICVAGACHVDAASVVRCDARHDSACTRATCDPATGVCAPKPRYEGARCSDTNACTRHDACHAGACVGAFEEGLAACHCADDAGCLPFEDGDRCNGLIRCLDERCLHDAASVPPPCDDALDTTCRRNLCQPESGACHFVDADVDTACDDGSACTLSDHCQAGACRAEQRVLCLDVTDACTVGVCQPATGACVALPANEGAACPAQNACVHEARCAGGQCQPWQSTDCDDDDPCTADSCATATGACAHVLLTSGALEACNHADDDCDGQTDEGLVYVEPSGASRRPGEACEGLGACGVGLAECAPDGTVTCSTNANGSRPAGVAEVCDGQDNDCDGRVDDGLTWLGLAVGEACPGLGACGAGLVECGPSGAAACSTLRGGSASEATDELCNGVDDDCDGATDDGLVSFDSTCRYLGVCAVGPVAAVCLGDEGWGCDYSAVGGYRPGDEAGACDGRDNDCDGSVDEDFPGLGEVCDADDPDLCAGGRRACRLDGQGVVCVDDVASVEACDGVDNDCDAAVDEDGALGCSDFFRDADGDGFGVDGDVRCLCSADLDAGYTAPQGGDCDDSPVDGGAISPTAIEVCNALDDDCDGLTDADDAGAFASSHLQTDVACERAPGVCAGATKPAHLCVLGAWLPCADVDYLAHAPTFEAGVEATCDGVDNDCDGATDEDFTYASAIGEPVAGVGAACGRGRCSGGITACRADGSGLVCSTSGALRSESCNGEDDDCDGLTDAADPDLAATDPRGCEKQQGACQGSLKPVTLCVGGHWEPCEALDYAAAAGAYEHGAEASCDGQDNDCDGATDDDLAFVGPDGAAVVGPGRPCGAGRCVGGLTACAGDGSGMICVGGGSPTVEACNGVDDDCDGRVDALDAGTACVGAVCNVPLQASPCERQAGECAGAVHTLAQCRFGAWEPCGAAQYGAVTTAWQPGVEQACDGQDNDCDGAVDEDFSWIGADGVAVFGAGVACGAGACAGGVTVCAATADALTCPGAAGAAPEACNGVDDDCDGLTDEGLDAKAADAPCLDEGACAGGAVRATCAAGGWSCDYGLLPTYEAGVELSCDNVDNDCDGATDEDFALAGGLHKGDACVGGGCTGVVVCAPTADSVECSGGLGYETCNDRDDDCDGATDEGLFYRQPGTSLLRAKGESCEGRGVCAEGVVECGSSGVATCSTNADGSTPQASVEICNGQDDDCDGDVDDGLTWNGLVLFSACDGEGACGPGTVECRGAGIVACSTNPNGSTPQAKPETCNGQDDDCDGLTDAADAGTQTGCTGANCNTPLTVVTCEKQAGVCAGATKPVTLCASGAWLACDAPTYRAHAFTYEPGVEVSCDGLDNDCDGLTDEDFTLPGPGGALAGGVGAACGVGACAGGVTTCSSDRGGLRCTTAGAVGPERCNGVDDDCDGLTDAADPVDLLAHDRQRCELQAGVCAQSSKPAGACQAGAWASCDATLYRAHDARYQAGVEAACDGVDNDCDGTVDEDFGLLLKDGRDVSGVRVPCGVGACAGGLTACNAAGNGVTCAAEAQASNERCNGVDDDCDGRVDAADAVDLAAFDPRPCANQRGVCAGAFKPAPLCEEGAWDACTPAAYAAHASAYEANVESSCDGADNDCDGAVDEDFVLVDPSGARPTGVGAPCGVGACAGGVTLCGPQGDRTTCSTHGQSSEEVCNGVDDDCDGATDAADTGTACGGTVCTTPLRANAPCGLQAGVCAGATRPAGLCVNGAWAACDADAYRAHDPVYREGAEGACDGRDDDCDGAVDEDFSVTLKDGRTVDGPGRACGVGVCGGGVTACAASGLVLACPSEGRATPEVCDGRDNDCDGLTDATDPDLIDADPQLCALQFGACAGARKPASRCVAGAWLPCDAAAYRARDSGFEPGVEVTCDGQDNDCDGVVDDDFQVEGADGAVIVGSGRPCGVGACAGGLTICTPDGAALACSSAALAGPEVCNGQDDDCDGFVDADDPQDLLSHDPRPCANQAGVCAGAATPPALCQQGAWSPCSDLTYLDHAALYQPAPETRCDGYDNDCDGLVDAGAPDTDGDHVADCIDVDDDADGRLDAVDNCPVASNAAQSDLDTDGAGDACDEDLDGDGEPNGTDCQPYDGAVRRGAPEVCNGRDDDCDGAIDAADGDLAGALQAAPSCENQQGACAHATKRAVRCVAGAWQACGAADYAAGSLHFQPTGETTCDGRDNDCDGSTDEDFEYVDPASGASKAKGDACGAGTCAGGVVVCAASGAGLVCSTEGDREVCDGLDNDCDGLTDAADPDLLTTEALPCENQAGVCAGSKRSVGLCVLGHWLACDAAAYAAGAPTYQPGTEATCDGQDNDCDGATDEDFSFFAPDDALVAGIGVACGVGACQGGVTVCRADGLGTTCSSLARVSTEICDGQDNDCDGATDAADADDRVDGFLVHDQPPCVHQEGVCLGTKKPAALCVAGRWQGCVEATYGAQRSTFEPVVEATCDGLDNDCSGEADEDFAVTLNDGVVARGVGVPCGAGLCQGGEVVCAAGGQGVVCSTEYLAAGEACNGLDDDCDGLVDAADEADLLALDARPCELQQGVCLGVAKPASLCQGGQWSACGAFEYGPRYQADVELACDGQDNDCDGDLDDDFGVLDPGGVTYRGAGVPCGVGACSGGVTTCHVDGSGLRCPTLSNAGVEVPNGLDDDCDGQVDE